jgi:tetratricopeptide (TPR) repeat protein
MMDGYRRNRLVFGDVLFLAVALLLVIGVVRAGDPSVVRAAEASIAELIKQLGSDQYVVRRRAEDALIRYGVAAFDQLSSARGDLDVEIAARATYLTQLIDIPWVQPGDPDDIRAILRDYGHLPREERAKRIRGLAALRLETALGPLCRIARYESVPLLSRAAALAVLDPYGGAVESAGVAGRDMAWLSDVVDRNIGRSQRPAAHWLRALIESRRDPQAGLARWLALSREESQLLAEHPEQTQIHCVLALMDRQSQLLCELGRRDEAVAVMLEMAELEAPAGLSSSLRDLLKWFMEQHDWTAIERLKRRFDERFARQALLRYLLAEARLAEGRRELAERLAAQALQLDAGRPERHFLTAIELEKRGLFAWSEQEYRHVIEAGPTVSENSLRAATSLAQMLHDQAKELQAGRVLQDVVAQVDKLIARRPPRPEGHGKSSAIRDPLRARMEFYFAAHKAQLNDRAAQRIHLDRAVGYDPLDADILIAMYRLPQADQAYRLKTRQLIAKAVSAFRQQIKQAPGDSTPLNQLAWLVGNTEGDADEAIAASQRSLEMVPGAAGYLDTLARCYYAKGDYARAVQTQRRAAAIEPHTMSIQRQLEQFQLAFDTAHAAGT